VAGVATVLSFASIAELFAKEASGRANAALNLLHVAGAFLIQSLTGFVVALWPEQNGHHPAVAYQTAFAVNLAVQVSALAWFLSTSHVSRVPVLYADAIHRRPAVHNWYPAVAARYELAIETWMAYLAAARDQVVAWRRFAIGSVLLVSVLGISLTQGIASQQMPAVHVAQLRDPQANAGHGRGLCGETITIGSQSVSTDIQSSASPLAASRAAACPP